MSKALLIVDHGSRYAPANQMLESIAAVLRRRRPDVIVHTAHMALVEPTIRQSFAACIASGATEIIVHPFMLSPGRHATRDIPMVVAAAAADFPDIEFSITAPLGFHEKIGEIVLERAGLL